MSAHDLEYSGDELAPYSDFSDTPPQSYTQPSSNSLAKGNPRTASSSNNIPYKAPQIQPTTARNASQTSGFRLEDDERVIWHGYLLGLRSKGGVKQWKKLWVVLRPKNLALYKNDLVRTAMRSLCETLSQLARNMLPTLSSHYQPLLTPWKSIPYRAAKHIACKLLPKRRAIASVPRVRMPWLNGWGP